MKSIHLQTQKVIPYVEERLENGNTLSKLFRKHNLLKDGTFSTLLSDRINQEFLYRLDEGNIFYNQPKPPVTDFVTNEIGDYLNRVLPSYCIFEEPDIKPHFEGASLINEPIFMFEQEMYYFQSSRQHDQNMLRRIIKLSYKYPGIGFLIRTSQDIQLEDRSSVDLPTLEKLQNGIEKLFVSVYDGESWVVWQKVP